MLSITRIQEIQPYSPASGQENCQSVLQGQVTHRKQLPSMISTLKRNHMAWSGQTWGSHPRSAGILACELKCNSFHFCQLIAHQKLGGEWRSLNPTAHSSTQSIRTNTSPSWSSINAFTTQPSVFSIPNPECSNSWKKSQRQTNRPTYGFQTHGIPTTQQAFGMHIPQWHRSVCLKIHSFPWFPNTINS